MTIADEVADWTQAILMSAVGLAGFFIGILVITCPWNFDNPIEYLILCFVMMIYGRI